MIAIAQPLPIGSRVVKTASWDNPRLVYGTTISLPYLQPGKSGHYVDVLWDGRGRSDEVHLARITLLQEGAEP